MYALFKETSHANFISHKSNYGKNPVANPKNWVAFDGQHVHYSTNNLDLLTQELVWYFRKTAGELNESIFNDRATITAIKGNSVVLNNIIKPSVNYNNDYMTLKYNSNGQYVYTIKQTGFSQSIAVTTHVTVYINHKYYFNVFGDKPSQIWFRDHSSLLLGGTLNNIRRIATCNSTRTMGFAHDVQSNCPIGTYKFWIVGIDLTILYGAGNEPNTCDQFEADYFKWFGHPLGYEPYDPGSIRNTKINGLKTIGFNQWDETYLDNKSLYLDNGNVKSQDNTLLSNYIKILPNTIYYDVNTIWPNNRRYVFYDSTKTYISSIDFGNNGTFTTPQNSAYMRFYWLAETYNGNGAICINISDSKLNGIHEPYEDRTYSIPITSITGKLNGTGNSVVVFPDGMKSVNKWGYFDEIVVEGGVTKAIKRVHTMTFTGTETYWVYTANVFKTGAIFGTHLPKYGSIYGANNHGCGLCNIYGYNTPGSGVAPENGWDVTDNNWGLTFNDKLLTTKNPTVDTWKTYLQQLNSAGTPLTVIYALETPEVYVLDNFSLPLNIKIWKNGSECLLPDDDSLGDTTSPKITMHYNVN